jgi:hypothetical protein
LRRSTLRAHHGLVNRKRKARRYWTSEHFPNILPNTTAWNTMKQGSVQGAGSGGIWVARRRLPDTPDRWLTGCSTPQPTPPLPLRPRPTCGWLRLSSGSYGDVGPTGATKSSLIYNQETKKARSRTGLFLLGTEGLGERPSALATYSPIGGRGAESAERATPRIDGSFRQFFLPSSHTDVECIER